MATYPPFYLSKRDVCQYMNGLAISATMHFCWLCLARPHALACCDIVVCVSPNLPLSGCIRAKSQSRWSFERFLILFLGRLRPPDSPSSCLLSPTVAASKVQARWSSLWSAAVTATTSEAWASGRVRMARGSGGAAPRNFYFVHFYCVYGVET